MALGFFAVGQFTIRKKTEPNLTKTNIFSYRELAHSENPATNKYEYRLRVVYLTLNFLCAFQRNS